MGGHWAALNDRIGVYGAAAGVVVTLMGWCLVGIGCASVAGGGGREETPTLRAEADGVTEVWGDWEDIDAAMFVGLYEGELDVLTSTRGDDRRGFELVSITGRRGELSFRRDVMGKRDSRGCELISIAARVDGPIGADQAVRLKRGLVTRLKELAGMAWAERK